MMLNDIVKQPLKQNWALSVKNLLSRLGFMDVWVAQGVGNKEAFLEIFKLRVKDIFIQDWHSRLDNSTRARCFITFAKFQYQQYLDILNIEKYRKSLSKLRLSSHRLEVEVGRWVRPNKIQYENRKCKICKVLEDEFHFLFECPIYMELRNMYISKYFWQRPNMIKFVELLTTEHRKTLVKLGIFVEKAFQIRKQIMPL